MEIKKKLKLQMHMAIFDMIIRLMSLQSMLELMKSLSIVSSIRSVHIMTFHIITPLNAMKSIEKVN